MDWAEIQVYMDQAKKHPLLSREDEIRLSRLIKAGPKGSLEVRQAEETFLNCNLRLVVAIARKFRNSTIPLSDLVQEGNIGMMHALEKFDPERGFKFSTYASWWIRQAMSRAVMQADEIRLPVYKGELRNRVRKVRGAIGDSAPPAEVAEQAGLTLTELAEVDALPFVGSSLDAPVGVDDGSALMVELIQDETIEDMDYMLMLDDIRKHWDTIFKDFSPRDRYIFEQRMAADSYMSLEDIGGPLGITRERVRQILLRGFPVIRERMRVLGLAP